MLKKHLQSFMNILTPDSRIIHFGFGTEIIGIFSVKIRFCKALLLDLEGCKSNPAYAHYFGCTGSAKTVLVSNSDFAFIPLMC